MWRVRRGRSTRAFPAQGLLDLRRHGDRAMIEIYPIDPDCPRVGTIQEFVLIQKNRDGVSVRDFMAEWVTHHATFCRRCRAFNAAKGEIDG